MPVPVVVLPVLGAVAQFIVANGSRAAARKYAPKLINKATKQIEKRQKAITKNVDKAKAKGEIPSGNTSPLQKQKSIETRTVNERAKRMKKPSSRVDTDGFPLDEVPLKFSKGGGVRARLSSGGPVAKPN